MILNFNYETEISAAINDRVLCALLHAWLQRRRNDEIPLRAEFNADTVPMLVLPKLLLAQVFDAGQTIRFEHYGSDIARASGVDGAGRALEEVTSPRNGYLAYLRAQYRDVVKHRRGIYVEGLFLPADTSRAARYARRVLLPLSRDGREVCGVVGAVTFPRIETRPTAAATTDGGYDTAPPMVID